MQQDWSGQVDAAQAALMAGRIEEALRLALKVCGALQGDGGGGPGAADGPCPPSMSPREALALHARALWVTALCLRVCARFPDLLEHAQRSAVMARRAGEPALAAQAMVLWAQAALALGSLGEALELTERVLAMDASGWSPPVHAQAWNYVGLVRLWSRDWDRAHEALARSIQACRGMQPPYPAHQPMLNRLYAQLYRVVQAICAGDDEGARAHGRTMAPFQDEQCLADREQGLFAEQRDGNRFMIAAAAAARAGFLGDAVSGLAMLLHVRTGMEGQTAHRFADLRCMISVVECLLHWCEGRPLQSALAADAIATQLADTGHRQFLHLGATLAARMHELAGDPAQALRALRRAHELQSQMHAEDLRGRVRLQALGDGVRPPRDVVTAVEQPLHEA